MSSIGNDFGKGGNQEVDLNLAPIIDCLTVLIAFMLASATFLSIGILDAGIAAGGKEVTPTTPPPISLTLKLETNKTMILEVTGKISKKVPFQSVAKTETLNSDYNFEALNKEILELKQKYPETAGLVLNANNDVAYRDVIKTMEMVRKNLPQVMLGGF